MNLKLTATEHDLLTPLIKNRVSEYYVEIRHAMVSRFKDDLKRKKAQLMMIQHALKKSRDSLDLSAAEMNTLLDCLEEASREMVSAYWHADNSRWRTELLKDKKKLAGLIAKVKTVTEGQAMADS